MYNELRNVNFKQFEDDFGNLTQEYEIIKYDKRLNGEWIEDERFNSSRNYYIIDGKIYHRIDNSLFPCNMDFDSATCGACYQIGKEIINNKKIIGNDILFTEMCKLDDEILTLSLHKQRYSDNTSFYSLQDEYNDFKLNYGSDNIDGIINQIEKEIAQKEKYKKMNNKYLTERFKKMYNWKINILNKLKAMQ